MIQTFYVDHMGTVLSVANAARVSFGKRSEMDTSDVWGPPKLKDKDAKLIRYLAKHKHISPFGLRKMFVSFIYLTHYYICLLYTSPSPRDGLLSRMPSSA